MTGIASWPYEQPPEEREMLAEALGRCQTPAQQQNVLGAFLLLDLLAEIYIPVVPDLDECWMCDGPASHARVYMRAGERAMWVPACPGHRTELILVA